MRVCLSLLFCVRLVRWKLDASTFSPVRHGRSAGRGLLLLQAGYRRREWVKTTEYTTPPHPLQKYIYCSVQGFSKHNLCQALSFLHPVASTTRVSLCHLDVSHTTTGSSQSVAHRHIRHLPTRRYQSRTPFGDARPDVKCRHLWHHRFRHLARCRQSGRNGRNKRQSGNHDFRPRNPLGEV